MTLTLPVTSEVSFPVSKSLSHIISSGHYYATLLAGSHYSFYTEIACLNTRLPQIQDGSAVTKGFGSDTE